jgi:hypothetical protein
MRAKRYQESDVDWTRGQREWLNLLCAEARSALVERDPCSDPSRPCA